MVVVAVVLVAAPTPSAFASVAVQLIVRVELIAVGSVLVLL